MSLRHEYRFVWLIAPLVIFAVILSAVQLRDSRRRIVGPLIPFSGFLFLSIYLSKFVGQNMPGILQHSRASHRTCDGISDAVDRGHVSV